MIHAQRHVCPEHPCAAPVPHRGLTDVWEDTFDDGMRAAAVLLIDLSREQPHWMPWRLRRRLRRGAYPWAYRMVENARVNRLLAPGVSREARVVQQVR